MSFHLDPGNKVSIHDLNGPGPVPAVASSNEKRAIEFKIRPLGDTKLPKEIMGAAFYYACEGKERVCRYLRHPIKISIGN